VLALFKRFILLVIGLSYATVCISETSVWEVSNGENRLFIGGTVHLLSVKDYPLPCEFDVAFKQADELYFETNIKEIENPEFAVKLMLEGTYPSGISLLDKLSAETQEKLTIFFAESSLPGLAFVKFKPGMLLSTLSMVKLQSLGMTLSGVDEHFYNRAMQAGKFVGYFETPDEHVSFILQLGVGNEDKFIEYMIESMGQFANQLDQLLMAWRTGDIEKMERVSDFDMLENEFPSIYQILIANRNNRWVQKIDYMLQNDPVEYVLVGGLHMAGDIGLIAQLRSKGYSVKQMVSACSD